MSVSASAMVARLRASRMVATISSAAARSRLPSRPVRIAGITDICDSFETLYCEVTDTEVATVTSAAALDNDQQFEIAKKLQKLTGAKNIKLKPKVDSSLISGLVIQYGKGGSKLLDMSAKGQLAAIEAQLLSQAPSA